MDMDKKRRRYFIRLAITEIIMVVAIVGIVGILLAVVSGWRVNKDLSVEQYGQVDIRSYPTGAAVIIDGEQQALTLTNTAKMLTEGEHRIELQKEGFESWSKVVKITPGWAVRLRYPRLFRQDRTKETVTELKTVDFLTVAPNRGSLLYGENDSKIWQWMTVRGDDARVKTVDLTKILAGDVEQINWAYDSERILVKTSVDWILVNLANPVESVRMNEAYATSEAGFSKVVFANKSGDKVWAMEDGRLYAINLTGKEKSKALAKRVADFAVDEQEVMYVTTPDENGIRLIYLYHEDEEASYKMRELKDSEESAALALSNYADEKVVLLAIGQKVYVYRLAQYPAATAGEWSEKPVIKAELDFTPVTKTEVSKNGEFVVLRAEEKVAVFDAEMNELHQFSYPNIKTEWVDDYLLGAVQEGVLTVRDFDGTNVRTLVVDDAADYPAMITENNRWLYYIAKTSQDYELRREQIN